MTLLFPLATLVGLTALVPLILHLYQRRRRAVIEFSTSRFFTAAIIRSQRRLRLRRLLLLVLRVATCLLLALALARPLTTLAGFGGRPGTRDVVIVLDDSLSMRARQAAAPPARESAAAPALAEDAGVLFERARELALGALGELTAGDRAALITFSGKTIGRVTARGLELSDDLLQLADGVRRLEPTFAAGDACSALVVAAGLFSESAPRSRVVLVLTDMQAGDWRQTPWPQPAQPVPVALVPVGADSGRGAEGFAGRHADGAGTERPPPALRSAALEANVVVDRMTLSQGAALVGQPNLLSVRIVNYCPEPRAAELVLHVDDEEWLRRPITLPGSAPHVEQIPLTFDRPGARRLRVRLVAEDALEPDNAFYAVVPVDPQLPVLLVDGERSAGDAASSAAGGRSGGDAERPSASFLRAALRAVSAEGGALSVDTISPEALTPAVLAGCRVVLLSGVAELSPAQLEALEAFVQQGGGLAIFPGDAADRRFYNEVLGAPTRPGGALLPAELGGLLATAGSAAGWTATRGRELPAGGSEAVAPGAETLPALQPLHVLWADVEHPLLHRFQGPLRSALAGIAVYRAYALQPRDARTLAALDGDRPLLVERAYGAGRVLLWATAPHPRWTNLPLRRAFVPLCSRLVSYLAGGLSESRQHHVGEDFELPRLGHDPERPVHVQRPDGSRVRATIRIAHAQPVAFVPAADVNQPGFYRLTDGATRPDQTDDLRPLAVNVPRRESSPDLLDLSTAQQLAGNWRLHSASADGAPGPATGSRPMLTGGGWLSRGMWDALLWTAFVLVLAEPLIAGGIVRPRGHAAGGAAPRLARLRGAFRGNAA